MTRAFSAVEEAAVGRFLQTALIVDDRLAAAPDERSTEQITADIKAPTMPGDGSQETTDGKGRSTGDPGPGPQLDIKGLGDRFADLGLTLGVLKPGDEDHPAKVVDRITAAGRRVDILILDWYLDEDEKLTARDALANVVAAGRKDRHLVAVYTTARQLDDIAEEIREIDDVVDDPRRQSLSFQAGATRIVLYNKGKTDVDDEYRDFVVPEEELATRLRNDFGDLVRGWVPAITLHAVAATRENTHRLLDRLDDELDLGFAGHVLRLGDADEATEHLLTAISGEFRAIVEDDHEAREAAAVDTFKAWLHAREERGLLSKSAADVAGLLGSPVKKEGPWRGGLVPSGEEHRAGASDSRFAKLLSLRRPYDRPAPTLTLGTIVRDDRQPAGYWLCVQPVCDAVRIKSDRGFPLLPLEVEDDEGEPKAAFHLVVPDPDNPRGEPIRLRRAEKPFELSVVPIAAGEDGTVSFISGENGARRISCVDGTVVTG